MPGDFCILIMFPINMLIIVGFPIPQRDSNPGQDLEEILQELRTSILRGEPLPTLGAVTSGKITANVCRGNVSV